MKPTNRYQKEVAELFPKLPPITPRQREYARTHRPNREAFYCNGEIWCPDCGRIIRKEIPRGHIADLNQKYACPCCGAHATLRYSRKTRFRQRAYFSVITIFGGWQVVRHYLCHWYFDKRDSAPWFEIDEVVQSWISDDGRHEVFVARPRTALSPYQDSFQTDKPMSVRYPHGAYSIWAETIWPHARVLPLARRNGFSIPAACDAMPPSELIRELMHPDRHPYIEMLVKIGQYALARRFYNGYNRFENYAAQIRICHRNRYVVRDAGRWCDYIDMLRGEKLDTHNAHYICPRNLKKAHDRLADKINRRKQRQRRLEDLEKAKKDEAAYLRDKGHFFDIAFGDDRLRISVFRTVADIAREGLEMHHCVFSAKYHRRENSLLLSACDHKGKHMETVEVNLSTFEVAQSRGKFDKNSPYHNQILRLMKRNMHLIRQAAETRNQSTANAKAS